MKLRCMQGNVVKEEYACDEVRIEGDRLVVTDERGHLVHVATKWGAPGPQWLQAETGHTFDRFEIES